MVRRKTPIYPGVPIIGIKFAIHLCKIPNCTKQYRPILLELIAIEKMIVYLWSRKLLV